MIEFEKYQLSNGLRVILSPQKGAQMACVNIMYDVGSRDESPERTGFAHLFEHLMFGGTPKVPVYDELVEEAGGSNNAFTSNDVTNYYINVPSNNLESALFLEADRMQGLLFTQKSLDVQKQVVIEEYKQRYVNQPYGDVFSLIRPLAYKKHSYQWPTIGRDMKQIEDAEMDEVKAFFNKHYCPNNAILCITGGFEVEEAKGLIDKYFKKINWVQKEPRNLVQEPEQTSKRVLEVERDVPAKALYMAFPMPGRADKLYPVFDLTSDILGYGDGSRLHAELVDDRSIFSSISCFVGGDMDPGLFYIAGHIAEGVDLKTAEDAVWECLEKFKKDGFNKNELARNKEKFITRFLASQIQSFHLAVNLCYAEVCTDVNDYNKVLTSYEAITEEDVLKVVQEFLKPDRSNVLYYNTTHDS